LLNIPHPHRLSVALQNKNKTFIKTVVKLKWCQGITSEASVTCQITYVVVTFFLKE